MQKKSSTGIGKLLYGVGGLSAITESVFLLLLLPWFNTFAVNKVALLVACVAGLALPVLVMPLAYAVINGNTAISTGRYHLYMTAAALITALSFVLLLGVGAGHAVRQAFALFGLLFIYSLSGQIFSYTYFAVGRRFDRSGKATALRDIFGMCAFLAAALLIVFLWDGSRDSVRAVVSLCAVILVLAVLATYMATASSMPDFIRMEPHHKRTIKESYKRFVSPLSNGAVRLFSVAALLLFAGIALASATVPACLFAHLFGARGYRAAVAVTTMLIAPTAVLVGFLTRRKDNKHCGNVLLIIASVSALPAAAVIVGLFVPLPKAYNIAASLVFAVMAGVTVGTVFAGEFAAKEYATQLSNSTYGKYGCLHTCVTVLGLTLGVAFAAVVNILTVHAGAAVAASVACGLCVVLFASGAAVHRAAYASKFVNRLTPAESAKEQEETA